MKSENDDTTPNDTSSPPDPTTSGTSPVWDVIDMRGECYTPAPGSPFDYDRCVPGKPSTPVEPPYMTPTLEQLTAQPGDEVQIPPRGIRCPRKSAAAQAAERLAKWKMQALLPHLFRATMRERIDKGNEFELIGGVRAPTSIQRIGERFTHRIMSRALSRIPYDLRDYGLSAAHPVGVRTQRLALRFGEALALHDLMHPGMSIEEIVHEAEVALRTVLRSYNKLDGISKA